MKWFAPVLLLLAFLHVSTGIATTLCLAVESPTTASYNFSGLYSVPYTLVYHCLYYSNCCNLQNHTHVCAHTHLHVYVHAFHIIHVYTVDS